MQEVFEKIKKNLVTELTFCSGYPNCSEYDYAYEVAMYDARNKATAIVNQVTEEYNNGWIPVGERLPKNKDLSKYHKVLVQTNNDEIFAAEWGYNKPRSGRCFSKNHVVLCNVIAWQPLPPKYQPKGDKE